MKLYKAKLRPKSSFVTRLQSDTVFGSLCWSIAKDQGKDVLREIIRHFDRDEYPFVVSSGFPQDLLPKPMAMNTVKYDDFGTRKEQLAHSQRIKRQKNNRWVSFKEFNEIINNKKVELSEKDRKYFIDVSITHNTISREVGTSLDEGGLYEKLERFYDTSHISLYFGIEDQWIEVVERALKQMEINGFGSGISRGKGSFDLISFEEWKDLEIPQKSNGHVLLSYYVPKSSENVKGQYKSYIKYGKAGVGINDSNPFKKPILMILPGAVFWGNKSNQLALGRMVNNVLYGNSEVIHCGCALSIPVQIDLPGGI